MLLISYRNFNALLKIIPIHKENLLLLTQRSLCAAGGEL